MCSVVSCDSWRRSAQRYKLPEDPERRLEWVQFLFEVNGQRLKESSWTDITICSEHFTEDCFLILTGKVQLKSSAVPSVCIKSEPDEHLESPQHVEDVKTTDYQCDEIKTCDSPSFQSEESGLTSRAAPEVPVSSDTSDAFMSDCSQMLQNLVNIDMIREKALQLQKKGKYVVNDSCLLQLFRRKCPSCGSRLLMEKVSYGVLIILNQQCLKCDYKHQWTSQVNASLPAAVERHLAGGINVTVELQQEIPTDDNSNRVVSEIVTFSDEESNPSDEGEEGDDGGVSSDGEWNPTEDFLLTDELKKDSEEETEDESEEDEESADGVKIVELCTECGHFFNIRKPHTCEHKIKPYSCSICGKRCVTEISLKIHSKIHDETYEHPCKYCYVTFKTRVDKLKHEQIHQDNKDPYKCPDCPQTFTSNKARRLHLAKHRAPKEFKCGVCGIEFKDVHHLRRHSVVHTGLKPYKCTVCQRAFSQGSHLKSHMRLHTGEKPYKCRHCDKCFNHNVSLKSHVQRYHSSGSGQERKKEKIKERVSDPGDAEDNGDKKGTDSDFDNAEEEQDAEEEVQKEKTEKPKSSRRSTGRPRGRPKRDAAGNLIPPGENKGRQPKRKRKVKKTSSSDEESEDEQPESDMSFESAEWGKEEEEEEEEEEVEEEEEEEEEEKTTAKKSTGRSRGRPKNDSDSDFDPEEETKKKKYSGQSSGKSSGKPRGRPKKNLEV